MPWADQPSPGSSFLCFGQMAEEVVFVYDGTQHANDLRSCSYTPLKGVVAWQENLDDWLLLRDAYGAAIEAVGMSHAERDSASLRDEDREPANRGLSGSCAPAPAIDDNTPSPADDEHARQRTGGSHP